MLWSEQKSNFETTQSFESKRLVELTFTDLKSETFIGKVNISVNNLHGCIIKCQNNWTFFSQMSFA